MLKGPIEFRSDNCGRAAPELIESLIAANTGTALGYGGDAVTARVQTGFSELFEAPVRVLPVATGTAGNALALAALATPFDAVYCSPQAHVNTSECNATGFFGGGTRLVPVAGLHGKVGTDALKAEIAAAGKGLSHRSQPAAVNIVQATDLGAVYSLAEVAALSDVARSSGLRVHMDGARFANAVATLGCTPAQATRDLDFHLRRAGQVWSKMRFASAQLLAYVEDDLWLRLARQANAAAAALAVEIGKIDGAGLAAPVQANELFVEMAPAVADALAHEGFLFHRRGPGLGRFVCRWDTAVDEVEALVAGIRRQTLRHGACGA